MKKIVEQHKSVNKFNAYECLCKIELILKEYDCKIEFDVDLGLIILDKNTKHFAQYEHKVNHKND